MMTTIEDFKHILLFKTNISCEEDKSVLTDLFSKHLGVETWTIDLDDCDCVLRVVSHTLTHNEIIKIITDHGYECCVLT